MPGAGGVIVPPHDRQVPGLQTVLTPIPWRAWRDESDLAKVDIARCQLRAQAPHVQREANRRLADAGRPGYQQDVPAGRIGTGVAPAPCTGGRTGYVAAGFPDSRAEAGPVPAGVPDERSHFRGRHVSGFHLHIRQVAGVHRVSLSERVTQSLLEISAEPMSLGESSRELIAVRAQPADGQRRLRKRSTMHATDCGLPDTRRAANPQHGNQFLSHLGAASSTGRARTGGDRGWRLAWRASLASGTVWVNRISGETGSGAGGLASAVILKQLLDCMYPTDAYSSTCLTNWRTWTASFMR